MDNNEAKNLLMRYNELIEEIEDWYADEAETRGWIEHAKTQKLSGMPLAQGKRTDIGNSIVLLDKIKARRKRKICEFFDFLLENIERFYYMSDADNGFLLYEIYFQNRKMNSIANSRFISDKTVYNRHKNALNEFSKISKL